MKEEKIIANVELSIDGPDILEKYKTRNLEVAKSRLEKLSGTYPLTSGRRVLVGESPRENLSILEAEVKTGDLGVFEYIIGIIDIEKQPPQIFVNVKDDYNALGIYKGDVLALKIKDGV